MDLLFKTLHHLIPWSQQNVREIWFDEGANGLRFPYISITTKTNHFRLSHKDWWQGVAKQSELTVGKPTRHISSNQFKLEHSYEN